MIRRTQGTGRPVQPVHKALYCLGGATALSAGLTLVAPAVMAGTFGSLSNFDVVNDTGKPSYGFEIEIEDRSYDHAGTISSVFGYDRVFGFISPDPGAVVRFGRPTITYVPGFGARINYGAKPFDLLGTISTPSAPYVTNGDSCWPGSPQWSLLTSCDHFGVSTYGAPVKTTYSWILNNGSGVGVKQVVGLPVLNVVYTPPPAPGIPVAPPQLVLPVIGGLANAMWVKVVKTTLENNVDLNDLLGGNHRGARPEIAGLQTEIEVEWKPLQPGFVDEVSGVVDAPSPSVAYQFQFYRYVGRYDNDGLIDPVIAQFPQTDALGVAFVTIAGIRTDLPFVGQQLAGFNFNEALPVPEPANWALWLAGLGLVGWRLRRG